MSTTGEPLLLRLLESSAGDRVALEDGHGGTLTYDELGRRMRVCAAALSASGRGRFGLRAPNGFDWVIADLAALGAGVTLVPLPEFFTEAQVASVLETAGVDALLVPRADSTAGEPLDGTGLALRAVGAPRPPVAGTAKVTFTSGTTGAPKGARLSAQVLRAVGDSLRRALETTEADRHLCVLPLSILLENVGGLYRVLLAGGRALLPDEEERGLGGSCRVDAGAMVAALCRHRPTSLILMPGMLEELVAELERAGSLAVDSLRFVGVGGAAVPTQLLERARAVGIPSFEGYGLTESASVVSLGLPGRERAGSCGRPLDHVRVRIAPDGEVLVAGAVFEGYLAARGETRAPLGTPRIRPGCVALPPRIHRIRVVTPPCQNEFVVSRAHREYHHGLLGSPSAPDAEGFWPTGDLGHLDADGFLFLRGRKRNMLVTSFGRNVSPEWVERELEESPDVRRAIVLGEGRPALVALLVPASGPDRGRSIEAWFARVRAALPDYARPAAWIPTTEEDLRSRGLLTPNGRPLRSRVECAFRPQLDALCGETLPPTSISGDNRHGLSSDPARRDSA